MAKCSVFDVAFFSPLWVKRPQLGSRTPSWGNPFFCDETFRLCSCALFCALGQTTPSWGKQFILWRKVPYGISGRFSPLWVKRPPVGVVTHQLGKILYSVAEGSVRDLGSFFATLGQTTPDWGRDPPVGENNLFGGGRFRAGSRVVFRHSGSNDPRLGS